MSDSNEGNRAIIRTSEARWLERLAQVYKARSPATIIDDAHVGISPETHTLFEMGQKAKLSWREMAAVCVALGIGITGLAMLAMAWFDPEPTSKLSLLIAGGVICVCTGGMTGVRILAKAKPPRIKVGAGGAVFEIEWKES